MDSIVYNYLLFRHPPPPAVAGTNSVGKERRINKKTEQKKDHDADEMKYKTPTHMYTLLEVLQRPQSHFSSQSRRKTQAPCRAVEAALVTVPIVAGRERTDARGIDIVGQTVSDTPPCNVRV